MCKLFESKKALITGISSGIILQHYIKFKREYVIGVYYVIPRNLHVHGKKLSNYLSLI